jgi:hypothetical protein
VKELGKFDPDDFDAYEDAFLNLLAQSYGVLREPLRYVVRPEEVPETFFYNPRRADVPIPARGKLF